MVQEQEDAVAAKARGALAWDDGDAVEEDYSRSIVKGKRRKRQRVEGAALPSAASATPSLSEGSSTLGATEEEEEEEEMANCLMLLARGHQHAAGGRESGGPPRGVGRAAGEGYYECKTCGKRFASFQALGGHRTSHTKLRNTAAVAEEKVRAKEEAERGRVVVQLGISPPSPPAAKARAHECSICGTEFASGQALGGHMRRHRPVAAGGLPAPAPAPAEEDVEVEAGRRESGVLGLDLNLPAPSTDDDRGAAAAPFPLSAGDRPIPALVDCHY